MAHLEVPRAGVSLTHTLSCPRTAFLSQAPATSGGLAGEATVDTLVQNAWSRTSRRYQTDPNRALCEEGEEDKEAGSGSEGEEPFLFSCPQHEDDGEQFASALPGYSPYSSGSAAAGE